MKNKRYTATRIQRILIYALLGISKEAKKLTKRKPDYIRVLGFNSRGTRLLRGIKKSCTLPVITNPSAKALDMLWFDITATDTYVLGYSNSDFKQSRQDLKVPPIIL